jgi:hypothetical protein
MIKWKEAGVTAGKFGIGAVGLTAGAYGMKKINDFLPANTPDFAKKIGPGLAGMLIAFLLGVKFSDDRLKALAFGIGLAGFSDVAKKLLGDKVQFIADNVPSLTGLPGYAAVNTGGIGWEYYRDNSLQGLGDAYALNGSQSMQGTSMQGGAMSAMDTYALNGDGYALN